MTDFEPLTSTVKPLSQSTITIRIIKSFPYRNIKNVILHDYDISTKTPRDLFNDMITKINSEGAFRPYRNVEYDSLKIYTHAHGSKTMNLAINFEHDEDWWLDLNSDKSLHQLGVGTYNLCSTHFLFSY
ncbi:CYFA0S01e09142g1_1 [Cyberlindnera fabianii]|uniref:CYFA0S01e09142g1_1 n=1 Tax=Cyberlindnera fabianii TaxID=36022 RepID=A0A061AI70_CYBFA|nr:CYFA0S01e09142g1_1 [Cyberlindnera fabianii]